MAVGGNFTNCNCGPDVPACANPTEPVATAGLCLADGTPIAVTVVRDCAGNTTQEGWIDLTTGAYTSGPPPAGAAACETRCVDTVCVQRCDDTDGDGAPDATYAELWCVRADGAADLVLTYQDDPSTPYTPVAPVECAYGCTESETVPLCDTSGPFLRRYTWLNGTATYEDVELDGQTPHVVTGTVRSCAGDGTGGAEPCEEQTPPAATLGLCLPDGTPIAVVVTRDCTGTVTQDGWINLTTGAYSTGAPPAGAMACGDSRAFELAGLLCDVDPATGAVLGLVLVEYEYNQDGSLASVRLVDPATGATYTLQGELRHCPAAGADQPEQDLTVLCDVQADGTVTSLVRDYRRDAAGQITGHTDYTLDGAPYTPAGTVGVCAEPCRDSSSTLLCDVAALDTITVLDPANVTDADGWRIDSFTNGGCATLNPPSGPVPGPAIWSAPGYLGVRADRQLGNGCVVWTGYDAAPSRWVLSKTFTAAEDGTAVISATGLTADGGVRVRVNGQDVGLYAQYNQPATGGSVQVPVVAGPNVIELEVRDIGGPNYVGGKLDVVMTRTVQFMRRTVVDCVTGETVSVTDTTLDGQPYTATGEAGQCEPVAECCETPVPETRVDVETGVLCLIDEASGAVVGRILAEWIYDDQTGDRTGQRLVDLATGAEAQVPAGAVLSTCPQPDRITRQVCVVESGETEFLTNEPGASGGVDSDWVWAPDLSGVWYPMYRVQPHPAWTLTDTDTARPAHWVGPHADHTVCPTPGETSPPVPATWYTRASWNLPPNVDPDTIRIASTVLNADNDVVQWRLNDGPWQPVAGAGFNPPAWTFPPTAVPGGRPGMNDVIVQIFEAQPAACPSPNSAGMMLHVKAQYDYEPQVWTQVIEPGGQVYYLDENGARQDTIPPNHRLVPCAGSGDGTCCPWQDAEVLTLCDTAADGTSTAFLRHMTYQEGADVPTVTDTELDGVTPYAPAGTVGMCEAAEEPCRTSSTLLLCDLPTDGAPAPTITDTDPTPYYPYPTGKPVAGGQTLWDGGSLDLSPGTAPQPGTAGSVNSLAATIQAPRPACDTGTANVTVSLNVQQMGPDDGCGQTGHLRLFNGTTQTGLTVLPANTPAGYFGTVTVEADVPAADLAAGNVAFALALDAYDDNPATCTPSPRRTGWQLSAFTTTVTYDQAGCATQILRNVITDCETGATLSVTDTTLDGQPYTVTGEVGQCQGTGGGQAPVPEPCRDTTTLLLCDDTSDVTWRQTSVDPDPNAPTGQGWLFRLSPSDDPSTVATIRVTTSQPDGQAPCGANGPRWYGTGTTFVYELDPIAQTIPTLRVNALDFDKVESLTMLDGQPDRLGGNAYTTGDGVIRSNVDNATGYLFFDGPPTTFSYRFSGACTAISFDAVSSRTTQFLRTLVKDCETGATISVTDTTLDGVPYTVTGDIGQCQTSGGGECCPPPEPEPCRNTSTLLVCDIPGDGELTPTVTDTNPAPYDVGTPGTDPVTGGAAALWSGGVLTIPPDTTGATDGSIQRLRTFAATVQAPRPGCDTGTATVTASIRVERGGPDPGCLGTGLFALLVGGTPVATVGVTPPSIPVGTVQVLTVTAMVPAADLAAGTVALVSRLETYHLAPSSCPGTGPGGARVGGWTVDDFAVSVAYDQAGCAAQVFANVVTDCLTGEVQSVTYTLPDGSPYEPQGTIGQCTPTGGGQPPAPAECSAHNLLSACRCDDTDGDGVGDVLYTELWAVDTCTGKAPTLLGTYEDGDFSKPYTPTAPVDCTAAEVLPGPLHTGVRNVIGTAAQDLAGAFPGLQSVSLTVLAGDVLVTMSDGISVPVPAGATLTWSVEQEADTVLAVASFAGATAAAQYLLNWTYK